jgi:hypothetical protein
MGCYRNAMEVLVEREVEEQMKKLPPKVAAYINRLELVAFALNHLPSLYATSERGLEHQLQRGGAKYATQVTQAVQRAMVAVRRDPIRNYAPLQPPSPPMMQDVLRQIKTLLNNDTVNWDSLPITIERALTAAKRDGRMSATSSTPGAPLPSVAPSPPHLMDSTGMTSRGMTSNERIIPTDMSSTSMTTDSQSRSQSPLLRQYSVTPRRIAPATPPSPAHRPANGQIPQTRQPIKPVQSYTSPGMNEGDPSKSNVYGWDDPFHSH